MTCRLGDAPHRDWAGALETVDRVRAWRSGGAVTIEARNMVPAAARYTARVLDAGGRPVAEAAADFGPAPTGASGCRSPGNAAIHRRLLDALTSIDACHDAALCERP